MNSIEWTEKHSFARSDKLRTRRPGANPLGCIKNTEIRCLYSDKELNSLITVS